MKRKQTIRLNEAQLKRVVAESVKRVLKENNQNTVLALAKEIGCNPKQIRQDGQHHFYVRRMDKSREIEYLVFDDEEQAKAYALQLIDAEGSAPLDYWIQNCEAAGGDMDVLFPHGNPNWDAIEEFTIDTMGPEWVLSGYDGQSIDLDNGQVAYRWD